MFKIQKLNEGGAGRLRIMHFLLKRNFKYLRDNLIIPNFRGRPNGLLGPDSGETFAIRVITALN